MLNDSESSPSDLAVDEFERQDLERNWPMFWYRWWDDCNIPPIHRDVLQSGLPFESIDERGGALKQSIDAVKDRRGSMYLWGQVGSGKTLLACSALYGATLTHARRIEKREWYNCPISPSHRFSSVPHLLQQIRKTYSGDGNADAIIDRHSYAKLLVMDDIGAESPTEWVRDILYQIVDTRYCNRLPTIFTSNLPLAKLESRLSDRIADRIVEMCDSVVHLNVPSYRLKAAR